MKSFESGFIENQPITQNLLRTARLLGEYKGKEELFKQQIPQALEALRQAAMIQSTESSNRIEGVTAPLERIQALVSKKTTPRNRSEQEIAGYRDVLQMIHANHAHIPLTTGVVLQLHRDLYRYAGETGGRWKSVDNEIMEIRPDGTKVIHFQPLSAFATPEAMEQLHVRFNEMWRKGDVEKLVLIPAIATYREFEQRVGLLTMARGAKTEMVLQAIRHLPHGFRMVELERMCPHVTRDMIRVVLNKLKAEGEVVCEGAGRGAVWRKRGNKLQ